MYIGKITTLLSTLGLAAALAAGTALAQDYTGDKTGQDDTTGLSAIGIDISTVGTEAASVHQFVAGLAPETQRGVLGGCQTVVNYPANVAPNVVEFCQTAIGIAPAGPALGFAAEEPAFMAPSPMIGAATSSGDGAY
jgi:hypothetical protein